MRNSVKLLAGMNGSGVFPPGGSVFGGSVLGRLGNALRTGRADVALVGDSNTAQLSTSGFWASLEAAFSAEYGLYASGVRPYRGQGSWESDINGLLTGGSSGTANSASPPAELLDYVVRASIPSFLEHGYVYIADGSTWSNTNMWMTPASLMPVADKLRWHYTYGTFPSGSGVFHPQLRIANQLDELAAKTINTNTGAYGLVDDYLELAANPARTYGIQGGPRQVTVNTAVGPFWATYQRLERVDRTTGCAFSTLLYQGGYSTYHAAQALQETTSASLQEWFRQLTRLQGKADADVLAAIWIRHGGNDRNSATTSLGTYSGAVNAASNTGAGIYDNTREVIEILRTEWVATGYDVDNLLFIVGPYHPQPTYVPWLREFEDALEQLATDYSTVAVIKGSRLTTPEGMISKAEYRSDADRAHLSVTGYNNHAARDIRIIAGAVT